MAWNLDFLKKTETPDTKELAVEVKKIGTEMRKADLNTIKVEYYLRGSTFFMETMGTIYRTTNFTIVILEEPNEVGLILADDSIYHNKATHKEKIMVKEGYPFSLNLESELTREFNIPNATKAEKDAIKAKYAGLNEEMIAFKIAHPEVKEYHVPILMNQIPLSVIRVKLAHVLPGFPDEMEVTQHIIYQLFFAKILSKVNKQKIQGAFMLLLVGFLSGAVFVFAVTLLMGRM
jgi:hypothetical protein